MPEDLAPMTIAADVAPSLGSEIAPGTAAVPATVRRASTGRRSASEVWADWRVTGSAASGDSFCESVLSWVEGASAQLVRPLWPAGGVRPTSADVQARLRKGLAQVVGEEPDYVKALEAARRHVARELSVQRARDLAAG